MTTSQQKTVLYFSPHQDDEVLSMGIDICNSVNMGQDVHVVLCTDGSKCNVRMHLADGKACGKHAGTHIYHLTEEELAEARDKEFRESCRALGVRESHVHIPEDRFGDRQLTVSGSKRIIMRFIDARGSDCVVCTLDPNYENSGQHCDHKALGYAAVELFNEGVIGELRLFMEPYYSERFKHKMDMVRGECRTVTGSPSKPVKEKLKKAVEAYSRWEPEAGRYAVGYHDIAKAFDSLLKNGTSYCHVWTRKTVVPEREVTAATCKRLVVTLTSYPSHINSTALKLAAVFEQKLAPDAVILWLAASDFPGREKDLPEALLKMKTENNLSICWCEGDLQRHDFYFRALKEYPDALVIAVDDDLICQNQFFEKLYYSYLLRPQVVSDAVIVFAPAPPDLVNAQRELDTLKNGWSFKIGRVITWLPRKARKLLKK